MVFEERVLREIWVPKRELEPGEWRELCNGELRDLYPLWIIIRVIKSIRRTGTGRVARSDLVVEPKWFRRLGTQRRRREDNIKMDVKLTGYESVDCDSG